MKLTQEYSKDIEGRFRYISFLVAALFFIVWGRLYYLQILRGDEYRFFSSENSIKELKRPAPRGVIFDRRGQVLVDNRPAFDVMIVPQYVLDPPKVLRTLARLLTLPNETLAATWAKRTSQPGYQGLLIKSDISADEVATIRAHKGPWYAESDPVDLRGVEVRMRYQRIYPDGKAATHLLGYVREIDAERLEDYRHRHPGRYHAGDQVGLTGLEEQWDVELRGADGFEQHVVDAAGREVAYEGIADRLEQRPAIPGAALWLSVDRDLQTLASTLFAEHSGAAVMVDVQTGEVRLLFSAHSYDLNRLAGPEGSAYWQDLATDESKPLLNRAIQGTYPPGSTFKIVTGISALSENAVQPNENITCHGALLFGGRPFHCWNKGGHGAISFHRALVESCDVYFYLMGLRVGVDRLAHYAALLGLGRATGIPLADEKSGLIPTAAWKEEKFGVPWQEGETLSIAVGQGYDLVTPLQNAVMIGQVVNGGLQLKPSLVVKAVDADGREIFQRQSLAAQAIAGIPSEVLERVRMALRGVVAEPGGTAHRLATFKLSMGGKTGTAQVVGISRPLGCVGDECRDHAWFVGFAPAEKPEVAAAVIVEHGGFGAAAAAPIVGELLQKYYTIEHGS